MPADGAVFSAYTFDDEEIGIGETCVDFMDKVCVRVVSVGWGGGGGGGAPGGSVCACVCVCVCVCVCASSFGT
jgi:hypothetical protein